jgi:hypothetical protein
MFPSVTSDAKNIGSGSLIKSGVSCVEILFYLGYGFQMNTYDNPAHCTSYC